MKIIQYGDTRKECPICNCIFEYESGDTYTEFDNEDLVIMQKTFVQCPCCKRKLLLSKHRAQ